MGKHGYVQAEEDSNAIGKRRDLESEMEGFGNWGSGDVSGWFMKIHR